jgi:hypothetical protein
MPRLPELLVAVTCLLAAHAPLHAQATLSGHAASAIVPDDPPALPTLAGSVIHQRKVSETVGGFTGVLTPATDPLTDPGDLFGISIAPVGDLDGDGIVDLAVGAYCDDEGGFMTGAIWILFMNADQTVRTQQKISKFNGNFAGPIHKADLFGWSLGALGDLDGDGSPELAVGGWLDDDGFGDAGAIWILSLNKDGTVKHQQKISATQGGFTGQLEPGERFGTSLVNIGDLDGDGVTDLAAGSVYDNQGGHLVGAEWILFLNPDGTVRTQQKITNNQGGLPNDLIETYSRFSYSACSLGDLDGDGIVDLAVGAITDHPMADIHPMGSYGCEDSCGAVWILFMNRDGTVRAWQKIGQEDGNFTGHFIFNENFAHAVACPGDLDGDGVQDLLVGSVGDGGDLGGGPVTGRVWALFLNRSGTVKAQRYIDGTQGGFTGALDPGDFFGQSIAALGDLDGDGIGDVAVGAIGDDDGGLDQGAFWFLYLYGASWSDAGGAVPGIHGLPKLAVESSLKAVQPLVVRVEQAAAKSPAFLAVSPSSSPKAFHGGTLVPNLSVPSIVLPLVTDGQGELLLTSKCPHGLPAGLKLYLQAWIKDPAAPAGFSATNALVGTTP